MGLKGQANIRVHSKKAHRLRCSECKRTFVATTGTPFFGLKTADWEVRVVIILLAWGCPIQALVQAFELDERTIAAWRDKAGNHCERIHQAIILQAQLDLQQIQAEEIRVKGRGWIGWMAMAIMVPTRLWLGGVVSSKRDKSLIQKLMTLVAATSQLLAVVLVVTDGFAAYPRATLAAFRTKSPRLEEQRGRSRLVGWPGLMPGQVVKQTIAKHLVSISRTILQGEADEVAAQITLIGGGSVLNTSYIERLNATFQQRLAVLCRHSRQAAHKLDNIGGAGGWLARSIISASLITACAVCPGEVRAVTNGSSSHLRWQVA